MKIKIYIFIVVTALFSVPALFSQTDQKPVRRVSKQTLMSDISPAVKIRFDKKFKAAGSQDFVLYDRADAEQFFFVEAENKKIKRMYMVQFEGLHSDAKGSYEYDEPQSVVIGGERYFSNAEFVPDGSLALKAVPDSDIARAAKFLSEQGFVLMKSLRYQRFVKTVGTDKRNEIIILYIEESSSAETDPRQTLSDIAVKSFKIIK